MLIAEILLGVIAIALSIIAEVSRTTILFFPAGAAFFAAAAIYVIRRRRG